jgi:hypothetical protein
LAIILSSRKPFLAVLLFLVLIFVPIVVCFDVLMAQLADPYTRWRAGGWISARVMYMLIPAGSLCVDLTCAPTPPSIRVRTRRFVEPLRGRLAGGSGGLARQTLGTAGLTPT